MKQESRKKYLIKNTTLFALNSLGTKLIVFFLVPVYTSALTTDDYGIADIVTTIAMIFVPLITVNVGEAVMRFSLDKDADHNKIMSVGILMALISVAAGLVIVPISSLYASTAGLGIYIYLYCISQGLQTIGVSCLRGREKLLHFAVCHIVITMCSAILNIIFLLVFHWGLKGYFSSFIIANFIGTIYAVITGGVISALRNFKIDGKLMGAMLKFSIVLVPNSLMWWIMNSSDRVMVLAMVGAAANGIYAISYKIPSAMSTVSRIFSQAWSYSAIHENNSADRDEFNNRMFDRMVNFLLITTSFLILIVKPFLKIYVGEAYYSAWKYTPALLIGFFFLSLATFLSTCYTVHKDSKGFLFSGMAGAVINIILNWILIPLIGVQGAAIATCISYVVVFFYRVFDTRKYIVFRVFKKKYIIGVIIMTLAAASVYIDGWIGYAVGAAMFCLILADTRLFIADVWRAVKGSAEAVVKKLRRS